jgi:hypothetical protein
MAQPALDIDSADPTEIVLTVGSAPPGEVGSGWNAAPTTVAATAASPGGQASFEAAEQPTAASVPTPSPYDWPGAPPVQGETLLNGVYVSLANTALTVVLPGAAQTRIHLYGLLIGVSGGSTVFSMLDGANVVIPVGLITIAAAAVPAQLIYPTAWTFRENQNVTLTFAAAGAFNIVTAVIQADRF